MALLTTVMTLMMGMIVIMILSSLIQPANIFQQNFDSIHEWTDEQYFFPPETYHWPLTIVFSSEV